MKTTLDLPDDVMTAAKVRAARENRKLKDIIANALRSDLGMEEKQARRSVRDIRPVSAGSVVIEAATDDQLEDMLDERGHRY